MIFRIHDVGGQRSERRKWLYLFDCVHAVIFCVSLTNYCQKASDDAEMNKMHEAIKVGSVTCITAFIVNGVLLALQHDREQQSFSRRQYHFISQQDRHLCRSLQKVNLIRNSSLDLINDEDFARIPIRTAFPDYTGKAMYEESLEFIQARFKEQRKQGPVSGVHYPNLEIHRMLIKT